MKDVGAIGQLSNQREFDKVVLTSIPIHEGMLEQGKHVYARRGGMDLFMAIDAHKETLGFQAEVRQLLDLMIHSLYSNKEIFLRELISNASDAIDHLRFAALSEASLYENDSDFKIRIGYDKNARTITVSDNGIGMTRDKVAENIGTIARSGTREFFQSLTGDQQKDAALI